MGGLFLSWLRTHFNSTYRLQQLRRCTFRRALGGLGPADVPEVRINTWSALGWMNGAPHELDGLDLREQIRRLAIAGFVRKGRLVVLLLLPHQLRHAANHNQ